MLSHNRPPEPWDSFFRDLASALSAPLRLDCIGGTRAEAHQCASGMQSQHQPDGKPRRNHKGHGLPPDLFDLQQNQREFDRGDEGPPSGPPRKNPEISDEFQKGPQALDQEHLLLPAAAQSAEKLHYGLELIAARLGQRQLFGKQ